MRAALDEVMKPAPPPKVSQKLFSTAMDDQDRVELHLLQGERPLVSQNRSLGRFQLVGIPRAPRGMPLSSFAVSLLMGTRPPRAQARCLVTPRA